MPLRTVTTRLRAAVAGPRFRVYAALAVAAAAAWMLRAALPPPSPVAPPVHASSVATRAAVPAPPAPAVLADELGPGETLSGIWERIGRPVAEMAAVVEAASAAFDVRQLRAGTPVEVHLQASGADRLGAAIAAGKAASIAAAAGAGSELAPVPLDSVVIRIDADRRLVVRARGEGEFRGQLVETPVREVRRTHVGCIEGSLYAALETETEDFSLLALELDKIYGGQIDFYSDLHPGDCVAVYFQTHVRPDGSFRLGRIEAAEFVNQGKRRPAVWFEAPDGTADYYDLEGRSLKRQFLKSPLKFTRISSGFTLRRFHPVLKRYRAHPGIDYAAPTGTPVQAAGQGVVSFAGSKRGYGKIVEIRHGKAYETSYAHLSRIAAGVRQGARVSQGELIGYVGSTGLSTGPHLDYRFKKNGRYVNPLDQRFPSGDPVAAEYLMLFAERRERVLDPLQEVYRTVLVDAAGRSGAQVADRLAAPLLGTAPPGQASVGDD